MKNHTNLKFNSLFLGLEDKSVHLTSISDSDSLYFEIESRNAFTKLLIDVLAIAINNQSVSKSSALLNMKFENPKDRMFQHPKVREKVKKI